VQQVPRGGALELATVLAFVDLAVDALAEAREEIDALNVYPVPDGDTGTNMSLTVSAAREALREAAGRSDADREQALAAFARGALLGARGNSGVILSEMLGALARRIARSTPQERNATVMAQALQEATDASYAAVGTPVEGTMLTVARAASEAAARAAAETGTRARDVFAVAARAAREALALTPTQLPALAAAGVVDAGGRGLTVVLDAAETALTGRRPSPVTPRLGDHAIPVPRPGEGTGPAPGDIGPGGPGGPGGPAYEVMYLLDAPDDRVAALRDRLAGLGDSLVVVGSEGLWNVHVHVEDAGAAIEAGIAAGRPHRIRVTHLPATPVVADPAEGADDTSTRDRPVRREGRAVVVVAAGPGLVALFEQAGAVAVPGGPGRRPSTGELVDAIAATGAREVVVLPNDAESVRAARLAAGTVESDLGLRVAVIPTRAQVEGLAAVAVHEPGRAFEADVTEMTATARHVRQGAVTVAAREAMTTAGRCQPGDALGIVAGDFAVVGEDLHEVATTVLGRLLAGGGELVTLVTGEDAGDLGTRTAAWVEQHHPHVDVHTHDGGQPRYPLLMSVE